MTKVISIEIIIELGFKYQSIAHRSGCANNDDNPTLHFTEFVDRY
jgi:hypothetical protein